MIGENIKNIRTRKAISQDRLSKLSDLSLNTIVKIESGKNANPTIKTLVKIARGMHVKVDDLIKVILVIFFFSAGWGMVLADESQAVQPDTEGKVITISEGIKIVLADSRLIKIAFFDNEMSYQDSLMSRSALLPHLTLEASYKFLKFQPASKFGSQAVNTAQRESFAYGFDVYQTLFDFGKSISSYQASQEMVKALRARSDGAKRVATLEFIIAYFDLLEAEKMIGVFEQEVESLSAYLNDVEHLYAQGIVVKNDVLPAKVRLADARQKLIAARNEKAIAAARLNNILGLPLREKIVAVDIGMHPVEFPKMEDAWSTAQAQRPELLFYEMQIKASTLGEKTKAAGNLPVIFAEAGYSNEQNKYQVHQDNFSAVLGAKMDLYDGGLARAQLLRERAYQRQLKEKQEKLLEDIKLEIEDSYFSLKNASEKVVVARDAVAQAEENVRFYRVKYATGSATPTEVLEAITQQTLAQMNYYNSGYELKRSYAKLMYSMGLDLSLIYERMESEKDGKSERQE
jgi:outer membrane protein TolC/DNA-binding XRE family transcriptional regulator